MSGHIYSNTTKGYFFFCSSNYTNSITIRIVLLKVTDIFAVIFQV